MAVAFNNANTATDVATSTFSGAMTVNAGSSLCAFAVIVAYGTGVDPSSPSAVTYNGVSMNSCGAAVVNSASHIIGQIFCLANPAIGSNTLAITGGANTTGLYTNLVSFTGVDQSTPVRAGSLTTNTGSGASLAITIPSNASDLTISVTNNGGGAVTSTDQTSDGIDNGGAKSMGSDHATTAGASVTHTWTMGAANNNLLYGVSVQAASASTAIRLRFPPQTSAMGVGGVMGGSRID